MISIYQLRRHRPLASAVCCHMYKRLTAVLLLSVALASVACAHPGQVPATARDALPIASVYLVNHGWHTGIVVKRTEIADGLLPERQDFPEAEYLELGWGDKDFYQAPAFSLRLALRAAFASKGSVLYVVGFNGPVRRHAPGSEIVEFELTPPGLEGLSRFIHESVARVDDTAVPALGTGYSSRSRFYPATGTFGLSNTCNTWAAKALQAAGHEVQAAATANAIMSQARRLGRVVQSPAQAR